MQFAEDDSPYPEVRSAVANFDDSTMPVSTFRAWVMGIIWAIILSGMNQFFHFRYPSVTIGGVSLSCLSSILIGTDNCTAGGTIGGIPNGSCLGTDFPCCNNIRFFYQSRAFHDKGTRTFRKLNIDNNLIGRAIKVLVTIMASVGAQSAYAVRPFVSYFIPQPLNPES
jgi:hypothetical protein